LHNWGTDGDSDVSSNGRTDRLPNTYPERHANLLSGQQRNRNAESCTYVHPVGITDRRTDSPSNRKANHHANLLSGQQRNGSAESCTYEGLHISADEVANTTADTPSDTRPHIRAVR